MDFLFVEGGTKSLPCLFCRLARAHPQCLEILDFFGQSKISWFDFWVGLKLQSKQIDKKRPVQMFTKFMR
jgi:hypothetical protein